MSTRPPPRYRAALAFAGLVATLLLGLAAPSETQPSGWEADVIRWLHTPTNSSVWRFAEYVRQLGSEHAAIVAAVCITVPLLALGRRRWGLTTFAAIVAGAAGAELAKHLVGRRTGDLSVVVYPSGHTAGATSVGVTLALIVAATDGPAWSRVVGWVGGVGFGLAVGWATITVHTHYPADVLGGIAFGICAPILVWDISWYLADRRQPALSETSPSPPPH